MIGEIRIEAGGEAVENRAHLSGHARILRAREPRNLERPVAPIASHAVLFVHLGAPAECAQVIVLDTPEVVLGLRVGEAKRGRRIRFAENVRNAVGVAVNRDVVGEIVLRASYRSETNQRC